MRRQLGTAPVRVDDSTTIGWVEDAPAELNHKRVVLRVHTVISSATPVFDTDDCDCLDIVNLSEEIVSMTSGMTGNPDNFQKLMVRIYSEGTYPVNWGEGFTDGAAPLLPITQPGKTHQVGLEYNQALQRWTCLASDILGF